MSGRVKSSELSEGTCEEGGERTRNSFEPECSLEMSNMDLRGVKVIMARSLFEVGERKGLETERMPWEDWKARS